jgi:O-antigen/teichoic acid export membrane protein
MLSKLRSLGKQTAVYGAGNILNKLLGFILIPIYQAFIPIDQFGNLAYFEILIFFLTGILHFGIAFGHQRFFYLEKEQNNYKVFHFNLFFGNLLIGSLLILPALIFSGGVSAILCNDTLQASNLRLTFLIILVEVLFVYPLQYLQLSQKPFGYLLSNASKLLISFLLSYVFVVHYSLGIFGILMARLLGSLLTLLVLFFFISLPNFEFKIDFGSMKRAIFFGFPMIISSLGFNVFMISDRFMLNWLSNPTELGKYSFGFKIANFINLIFIQTIAMSYYPSVISNENEDDNKRYYRKMLTYYCFFVIFLILIFLFYYEKVLWIVGKNKEYWDGLRVVPVLALSYFVMGFNYFSSVGIFLKKATKKYLMPSFSALFVNIGLNILLIPKFGMMGTAFSILAAQLVYTVFLTILSEKIMKVHFEWGKITLIIGVALTVYFFAEIFFLNHAFLSILFKTALLFFAIFLLFKFDFFEQVEIIRLKEGFHKVLTKYGIRKR